LEVEIKAEERTDGVSSPPAALILAAAGLEAQRLGHAYIGVEHVILALTREASGWLDEITAADGNAASLRTDVLARIHRRDS
jgi:ATP-dependent Clp protease ATP-binding subunit ClpA